MYRNDKESSNHRVRIAKVNTSLLQFFGARIYGLNLAELHVEWFGHLSGNEKQSLV